MNKKFSSLALLILASFLLGALLSRVYEVSLFVQGKAFVADWQRQRRNAKITPISEEEARRMMREIESEANEDKQVEMMKELALKASPTVAVRLLNESSLPIVGQTHLIAHAIGEAAYELYGENALPYCEDDRLNGCSHGLMLKAIPEIGFSGIKEMIKNCRETQTHFKYQMCLHAAGHAFTAIATYDIPAAISRCDALLEFAHEDDVLHCYNGLFMENSIGVHDGIGPFEHPWLSTEDLLKPCNVIEEKYRASCYLNQAGWWLRALGSAKKMAEFCTSDQVPENYRDMCANDTGRVISTLVKNDFDRIKENCAYLKPPWDGECLSSIGQSVFAMGDEELPFRFCREVGTQRYKDHCYLELGNLIERNELSAEKTRELCAKFEPDYRRHCERLL